MKKKQEFVFGTVELICYFDKKIWVGVQILQKHRNMFPNQDYPYLKKDVETVSLAFFEPGELQTIGYLECDVDTTCCYAPLFG